LEEDPKNYTNIIVTMPFSYTPLKVVVHYWKKTPKKKNFLLGGVGEGHCDNYIGVIFGVFFQ
jgi:hypothetical protein